MTCVDLNPIRAEIADESFDSNHTIIQRRLRALQAGIESSELPPGRFASLECKPDFGCSVGLCVVSID